MQATLKNRFCPYLEALEDRLVLDTYWWRPVGGSTEWTDGNNWQHAIIQSRGTVPGNEDFASFDGQSPSAKIENGNASVYGLRTTALWADYINIHQGRTLDVIGSSELRSGRVRPVGAALGTANFKLGGGAHDWYGFGVALNANEQHLTQLDMTIYNEGHVTLMEGFRELLPAFLFIGGTQGNPSVGSLVFNRSIDGQITVNTGCTISSDGQLILDQDEHTATTETGEFLINNYGVIKRLWSAEVVFAATILNHRQFQMTPDSRLMLQSRASTDEYRQYDSGNPGLPSLLVLDSGSELKMSRFGGGNNGNMWIGGGAIKQFEPGEAHVHCKDLTFSNATISLEAPEDIAGLQFFCANAYLDNSSINVQVDGASIWKCNFVFFVADGLGGSGVLYADQIDLSVSTLGEPIAGAHDYLILAADGGAYITTWSYSFGGDYTEWSISYELWELRVYGTV